VDIKRYQFLRKVAISYTPLSVLPIAFAWSMPVVAFTIYVIMMIGGIVAGFWVKVIED
jgi:Na+/citrate or Na+/malate symporter